MQFICSQSGSNTAKRRNTSSPSLYSPTMIVLILGIILSPKAASAFISPCTNSRLVPPRTTRQSIFAMTSQHSSLISKNDVILTSAAVNDTMPYFMSLDEEATAPSAVPSSPDILLPLGDIDPQSTERKYVGHDIAKALSQQLVYDVQLQQSNMYPSIAISYDDKGMVQAEASSNGEFVPANYDSRDYPAFIKFLYKKDDNGQTVASKLFNLALLTLSFSYVFFSVFNIDKGMTRGWTPGEISLRIPLDTWASYENSLSEKPVATKTIINVVIYLLGDWLSQTLFQGKNVLDFDAARTIKNGFIGMCFGPAVHEYYEFSDWILPVDGATFGVTNRAFKILMDQTIYLSIKCSIYIIAIGVLNGDTVGNSTDNVKNRLKPIMFTAWKFWPLVHCVTYGLIPARHRILWVNSVDLVWNAILASKARDDSDEDDNTATEEKTSQRGSKKEGSNSGLDLSTIVKDVALEMEGNSILTSSTLPTESNNVEKG